MIDKLNFPYILNQYRLIPLRKEDIIDIMNWRNDQMNILRQKKLLTPNDQINYYKNVVVPSFNELKPSLILLSFLFSNKCIGYGGLTNIDWNSKRAEVSFLLDTKRIKNKQQYDRDFSSFLTILKKIAFEDLKFNRLFTETFDIRPYHISILEKNGFVLEGRMREHVLINNKFVDSLLHGYLKKNYKG